MSKHFLTSLALSVLCVVAAFYSEAGYEVILWGIAAAVWTGGALEELMLYMLAERDDDATD